MPRNYHLTISHANVLQEFASQVVHFPEHSECRTTLAPDPDDIVWNNMGMTHREHIVRSIMITGVIIAGLLFWIGE